MAPFWKKYGILHLSHVLNESGDSNFFSFFLLCVYHEIPTLGSLRKFSFLEQLLMNYLNSHPCLGFIDKISEKFV